MLSIAELVIQAKTAIKQSHSINALELVRVKFLGKRGYLTQHIKTLHALTPSVRTATSVIILQAKQEIKKALAEKKVALKQEIIQKRLVTEKLDISLPGRSTEIGGLHPLSITISRIKKFFSKMGFSIAEGPEIEDSYHNFEALNIPAHHPARTDQDTFWLDQARLLRTQTSGVQIRVMKTQHPPIRIVSCGRVYRKDYDQNHTPMFHQMEGLIVDTDISFVNLKSTLYNFLLNFFDKEIQIRFRPSYFPFTEPSAEVDIMGKDGQWIEVLGCGMVHPNVLCNVDINPEIYSGFAFGIGIERLAMLRYNILDLRMFFENDLRFLKQFK